MIALIKIKTYKKSLPWAVHYYSTIEVLESLYITEPESRFIKIRYSTELIPIDESIINKDILSFSKSEYFKDGASSRIDKFEDVFYEPNQEEKERLAKKNLEWMDEYDRPTIQEEIEKSPYLYNRSIAFFDYDKCVEESIKTVREKYPNIEYIIR